MTYLAVLAATLFAMGVTANATATLERGRAVATALAAGGLILIVDAGALDANTATRLVGAAAVPAVYALLARAMAGGGNAARLAFAGAALAGPVHLMLDDPFRDPNCHLSCESSPFALLAWPDVARGVLVLGWLVLVGALVWAAAERIRQHGPLVAAGVAIAAVAAARQHDAEQWLRFAASIAVLVLGIEIARATTRRARLAAAVSGLSAAGDPSEVLATFAPGAEIGYRVPGVEGWVTRAGAPLVGTPPSGCFVELRGPTGPIAQIRAIAGPPDLEEWTNAVRGPARLAIDNARHEATVAVRQREVLDSCRQLVAAADDERRRIERDLHDGAQQQVLTLGLQIGMRAGANPPGEPVQEHLVAARDGVNRALDELREIAHGIHAATLASGLEHALDLLAYRSPVPFEVGELPAMPVDPLRALAVHALVEEAVWEADGPVRVDVVAEANDLRVRLTIEGTAPPPPARGRDRVRALGGDVSTRRLADRWVVEAALPGVGRDGGPAALP